MSDDRLLRALGRVAAQQTAERERGEASASPGQAASGLPGRDAELARRLFAPASDESVARMTGRVLGAMGAASARPPAPTPIRGRALRWAGLASLPVAAAAALALYVSSAGGDFPRYTLSVTGGARAERGVDPRAASEPLVVAPGTEVVLLARPDARATGAVHAATFARRSGAPAGELFAPVPSVSEASEKGALRVIVRGEELGNVVAGGGLVDLVLVVDRSAASDSRALAASDGATSDWARFTVSVRVPPQFVPDPRR